MNIVFKCEFCQTEMQASEDAVGKQCFCVSCGMRTIIGKDVPPPPPPAPEPANVATRSATDPQLLSINCPTCTQRLDYGQALIGTKGLCRHCHELFMLPKAGQSAVILKRRPNYIAFQCPNCLQLFEGSTTQVGLKGRCTNCESVFAIEALDPKPPSIQTPTAPPPATPPLQSPQRNTAPTTELDLAPEPQATPQRPAAPAQQSKAPPSMSRPTRPTSTLKAKSTPQNKTQPDTPSIEVQVSDPGVLSGNIPWNDLGNLNQGPAFPSISDAYYPSSTGTYSAPKKSVSVGQLFSSSMDCLFPAAFVIAVPSLVIFLINLLSQGAIYGLGYIMSQLPDDQYFWYVRLFIFIIGITILVCTPFIGLIVFFPLQFKLANLAAKGKEIDTSMMHMSMSKRMSIVGYCIVQPLLLTPLYLLAALPTFLILWASQGSSLLVLMSFFSMLFSVYAVYVLYSMFTIGACAVADGRGVGEAISISFRSLFHYPLVLLPICALEIIPIFVLAFTVLGFVFVGFPYLLIRSARLYQMTNK